MYIQYLGHTIVIQRRPMAWVGIAKRGGTLSVPQITSQDDEDLVEDIKDRIRQLDPVYIGYQAARAKFLSLFKHGFGDPSYHAYKGERGWKNAAAAALHAALPLKAAQGATPAQCGALVSTQGLWINMVYPAELQRLREVLRSDEGPSFIRAAGGLVTASSAFGRQDALRKMDNIVEPFGGMSWPLATFLPFLWSQGDVPFITKGSMETFARQIADRFQGQYGPSRQVETLDAAESMVRRVGTMLPALDPALVPGDRMDVQGFIWVVAKY